jgi:hypothetical protein
LGLRDAAGTPAQGNEEAMSLVHRERYTCEASVVILECRGRKPLIDKVFISKEKLNALTYKDDSYFLAITKVRFYGNLDYVP